MRNNDIKRNERIKILRTRGISYVVRFALFSVALLVLGVIGLIIPLRPEYSNSEKRELAKFPEFSSKAFFSGAYFRQIGDWYSDTYPGREKIVELNTKLKSIYGIQAEEIHGEVIEGDDIPDEYVPTEESSTEANAPTEAQTEPPEESYIVENEQTQSLGAVFVVGGKGFEYYNFTKEQADRYISLINRQAQNLEGTAKVYDMIVPTSIAITLPDNYMKTINSSDQKKAIEYFHSGFSPLVNKVEIYPTLMHHRREYIYFNTDHHWTALGAFYSYEKFAEAAGIPAKSLDSFEKVEFSGFLGSFYNDTGKIDALGKNPDTLVAYKPKSAVEMVYTDKAGTKINWPVVNDVTSYPASIKYSAFIGGDNPFTEITNPSITDGSSIIVVKESFGNAFVPFLTESYNKIYVVDYRYYKGSISALCKEKGVNTVLYINNISATRNKGLISKLEATL